MTFEQFVEANNLQDDDDAENAYRRYQQQQAEAQASWDNRNNPGEAAYRQQMQAWVASGAQGSPPQRPEAPPQISEADLAAHRAAAVAAGTSSGTGVMDRNQPEGAVFGGKEVGGTTVGGFNDLVPTQPGATATLPATDPGRRRPSLATPSPQGASTPVPGTGAAVVGGNVTNTILPGAGAAVGGGTATQVGGGVNRTQPTIGGAATDLSFGGLTAPTANQPNLGTMDNRQPGAVTAAQVNFNNEAVNQQGGSASGPARAASGPVGRPTYQELLAQYRAEHNGQNPGGSPEEQAAFNEWAGTKAPNGWTDPVTLRPADIPAVEGENFRQTQVGSQTGSFDTTGQTNTATGMTSGQNTATNKNTVGLTDTASSSTTGSTTGTSQTGATTGTVAMDNTSTTGVTDTLGFGELLKGQTGAAQAADAARQGYLTDLVSNGGANFNSQVDQAVRNSLSGPQMTGAGDSARARASGYAAAEIARKNTGDRLNAASQLAGPTAVQGLVGAGTPFLGSTTTNKGTQTTDMKNVVDTLQNTTGFQDLVSQTKQQGAESTAGATQGYQNTVGQENTGQSGTATGGSSQTAAGKIPEGKTQTAGGGGCIICTAGMEHGLWRRPRLLRRVTKHKLVHEKDRFLYAARGYFYLFGPIAKLALRSRTVSRLTMPVANAVVYEEARLAGVALPFRAVPWVVHWTWHGVCALAGRLPVRNDVGDASILAAAQKHGTFFPVAK